MTTVKAVTKARAEVVRLMKTDVDLSRRRAAKLLEAGAHDGEAILAAELAGDAAATSGAAEKAAKARGEAEALASAIEAARRVRTAAIQKELAAEAEGKREEAATLRAEAGTLQDGADVLLEKLRKLTDVAWVPGPKPEYLGAEVVLAHPLAYGIHADETKMAALLARADALDVEATALEVRTVPQSGTASGADVTEVFAAVCADPFRIGPTLDELTEWAGQAEAKAVELWRFDRLSEHVPADDAAWRSQDKTFTVVWKAGGIVDRDSSVTLARVANGLPPREGNPVPISGAQWASPVIAQRG